MPPLDPETQALINYLLSIGGGGSPTAALGGAVVQPSLTSKGELEPYDVDFQSKITNQWQNLMSSLADPMSSLVSGAGSFGASPMGGGFAGGGGLNPLTTETVLETPAIRQMTMLANAGTVTPETYIANMLVNNQAQPSLIVADLKAKLADPAGNGLDDATVNLFNSWLPQTEMRDMQGNPTGQTTIDWNAAAKKIEDVASPYLSESSLVSGPDIRPNQLGQFVQYGEKPSPTMEYLQKLGLPDPRQQYGIDFAVQNDPELSDLMTGMAAKGQAYEASKKAYEAYLKKYPVARAIERQGDEMRRGRQGEFQNAMANWQRGADEMAAMRREGMRNARSIGGPIETETGSYLPGDPKLVESLQYQLPGQSSPASPTAPGSTFEQLAPIYINSANQEIAKQGGELIPMPRGAIRPTPATPGRPTLRAPSLIEQMYSRVNAGPNRGYDLWKQSQKQRTAGGAEMLAMVEAIAPGWGAMRAGRTPFKDAIMSRLGPIFAAGGANG